MAIQNDLGRVWAETGGITDPGSSKYSTGWISEIPTYQNFNYVLKNVTDNLLYSATYGGFTWDVLVTYERGSVVIVGDIKYTAVTSSTGVDPVTDTGNYWTQGATFGLSTNFRSDLGLMINVRSTDMNYSSWVHDDLSIFSRNPLIHMGIWDTYNTFNIMNSRGEFCIQDLGVEEFSPDGRDSKPGDLDVHRVFHEGHPPVQSEVAGTIPANPIDNILYGRKNGNWIKVTTTDVSDVAPTPLAGNGAGWYNTEDATFYIDINDGNSSQWVPASPSTIVDLPVNRGKNILVNGNKYNIREALYPPILALDNTYYAEGSLTDFSVGMAVDVSRHINDELTPHGAKDITYVSTVYTASGYMQQMQVIDNPGRFAGKVLTYTAEVHSDIPVFLIVLNGSGQLVYSDSSHTGLYWSTLSVTFTVSSLVTNSDALFVYVSTYDQGPSEILVGNRFSVGNEQLEMGAEFTEFEVVDTAIQNAACERLYEGGRVVYRGEVVANLQYSAGINFRQKKRETPTITLGNVGATYFDINTYALLSSNDSSMKVKCNASAVIGTGAGYEVNYIADAAYYN